MGIAPFQLLPQAYKLLAGRRIFCASKEIPMPTPAEVLYFYKLELQLNVKYKTWDIFYRLKTRSNYPTPYSTWKHPPKARHYWFKTSGFLLEKNPTLVLDFHRVGKLFSPLILLVFLLFCLSPTHIPGKYDRTPRLSSPNQSWTGRSTTPP